MNRRSLLLAAVAASTNIGSARAASPAEKFWSTWDTPRGETITIWPARHGLDLLATLDAIARWKIAPSSGVVIRLEDGIHAQPGAINLSHSDGARISVIGNVLQPSRCKLAWNSGTEGIYAGPGMVLGMLDGMHIVHTNRNARGHGSGILADKGGVVRCGRNVHVQDFYYGFQARFGGVIDCSGTSSTGAGDANYFAYNGGHLLAQDACAKDARDSEDHLGFGFVAEFAGTIDAAGALAESNAMTGFAAMTNGVIRAHRARALRNGEGGFLAAAGGVIEAHDAVALRNCGPGRKTGAPTGLISGDRFTDQDNAAPASACFEGPAAGRRTAG